MTSTSRRILFMEDDIGVARLFQKKLTKLGYIVDLVVDGHQGLARVAETHYDLVAVDHRMPGISGLDVIAEMNKLEYSPPVIMVTGAGCERTAAQALKMGAHDYIVKDIDGVFFDLLPSVITRIFHKLQIQEEQRETEEALRESEVRYRSLVECSPDCILLVTDGKIEFANCSAYRLLRGTSPGELTGQFFESFVREADVPGLRTHMQMGLKSEPPAAHKFETTILSLDEERVDVEIAASYVPAHARRGLQIVLHNIMGRKQAEATLNEVNEEMEFILRDRTTQLENLHREIHRLSSNTAVDRKATDVLHNVKNVLNSLVVSSSIMEQIIDHSKVENVGKVANLLLERKSDLGNFMGGEKKGQLIPDFLSSLAKILENERTVLRREIHGLIDNLDHINVTVNLQQRRARLGGGERLMDIEEIIDESLKISQNSITRYGIEVERSRLTSTPLLLDRHKIMQILVNLINNGARAVEGLPTGAKRMRISCAISDKITLSVEDNGVGITQEHMKRLFDYGFTTRKAGHGFGLHSCLILAREMNGRIVVNSDGPGEGACFSLILPIRLPVRPTKPGSTND